MFWVSQARCVTHLLGSSVYILVSGQCGGQSSVTPGGSRHYRVLGSGWHCMHAQIDILLHSRTAVLSL